MTRCNLEKKSMRLNSGLLRFWKIVALDWNEIQIVAQKINSHFWLFKFGRKKQTVSLNSCWKCLSTTSWRFSISNRDTYTKKKWKMVLKFCDFSGSDRFCNFCCRTRTPCKFFQSAAYADHWVSCIVAPLSYLPWNAISKANDRFRPPVIFPGDVTHKTNRRSLTSLSAAKCLFRIRICAPKIKWWAKWVVLCRVTRFTASKKTDCQCSYDTNIHY